MMTASRSTSSVLVGDQPPGCTKLPRKCQLSQGLLCAARRSTVISRSSRALSRAPLQDPIAAQRLEPDVTEIPASDEVGSGLKALATRILLPLCLHSCLWAVALPSPAVSSQAAGGVISGPARIIDGDTLEVSNQKIRIFGVDAPEKAQLCKDGKDQPYACGVEAKNTLEAKIGRQLVRCNVQYLDQYGRAVASCAVNGDDLGEWMVRRGEAVAYREYSQDYIKEEEEAARTGRGIWAGSFEVPKEWRRRNNGSKDGGPAVASGGGIVALPQAARLPGCDIKGNISSSGERIYHTPEGRYYASTKIDTSAGERWFCTQNEAEAAGWRLSKQ